MTVTRPEAIFDRLLHAAEALRGAAQEHDGSAGAPLAFRRSTLGLASLIESWCVDHADRFLPDLVDGRRVDNGADERSLLEDIVARVRR